MATNRDNLWWKTEEMYQRKKQGFWHINQVLDGNWTEIGRPKGANIYYNMVAPFYVFVEEVIKFLKL